MLQNMRLPKLSAQQSVSQVKPLTDVQTAEGPAGKHPHSAKVSSTCPLPMQLSHPQSVTPWHTALIWCGQLKSDIYYLPHVPSCCSLIYFQHNPVSCPRPKFFASWTSETFSSSMSKPQSLKITDILSDLLLFPLMSEKPWSKPCCPGSLRQINVHKPLAVISYYNSYRVLLTKL